MATSAGTTTQHAVRLLAILGCCGDPVGGGDPDAAVGVVRSELRVQALDFWLKNPDYLADEIVTAVEAGKMGRDMLKVAAALLSNPEPQLRHLPTPKWFYGAYERVDDAFALLETYGLAFVGRLGVPPKRRRTQFFLTAKGQGALEEMAATAVLDWYVSQARLVNTIAGSDPGKQLKARQYKQDNYAQAEWGSTIASIAEQVRTRLEKMGEPAPAAPRNKEPSA